MSHNDVYELYASAAYEFPDTAKWMPDWFTKHNAFSKVKGNRIFKIFSTFGLKDFREQIADDASVLEDYKDRLISFSSLIIKGASNVLHGKRGESQEEVQQAFSRERQLEQITYRFMQEVMRPATWVADKHRLTIKIESDDKRFRIDAGTSIVKAYNILKDVAIKLGINAPAIELTQEFKNYSKRGGTAVIFSTNPEDIAGMSSRSEWESCQTLSVAEGLNGCVVGSVLSKFIGIVYITSGTNYEGRGERMMARCLVRFAIDTNNNKPAILIDKMYPSHNMKLLSNIKDIIQKRTSVPVYIAAELKSADEDFARFRVPQEVHPGMEPSDKSYMDTAEVFTDKGALVTDPVHFTKKYMVTLRIWLNHKIAKFIEKDQRLSFEQSSFFAQELGKKVIARILESSANAIAKHYLDGKKPMSDSRIKEIFFNEIKRPIQKIKISKLVNVFIDIIQREYGDSYFEDSDAFKKKLTEFIRVQLTNIPNDYVI